jgi:Flp pilus assembly protein TadG
MKMRNGPDFRNSDRKKAIIRRSESGQIVVLATAAILVMIGFAGLVVDVGFLYTTRRHMQTAADAAAIAGANALNTGQPDATATSIAEDVARLNGYKKGGPNGTTITVGPPANPPNPVGGTFVQATVAEAVPTFFLRALGYDTLNVSATAVAGYAPAINCIIATDPTDQQTLVVSGSAAVTAGCGIEVESSNSDGFDVSGGATVTGGSIGLVSGGWTGNKGGPVNPTPVAGVAPVRDPFASLAPPPQCPTGGGCGRATCDFTNFHPNSSTSTTPGVYCGGITVSGSNTLTLAAGTYVLVGGGLQVGGGANLIGTSGVTFYNTYSNANPYTAISLSGGSSTNLVAPTSGQFNGILFFQDRTAALPAKTSNNQETISASNGTLVGGIYFPNSPLTFSGFTSVTPQNTSIVAYTITISGNANLDGGNASNPNSIITTKLYE